MTEPEIMTDDQVAELRIKNLGHRRRWEDKPRTGKKRFSVSEFREALEAEPYLDGESIALYAGLFERALHEDEQASLNLCQPSSWGNWRLGMGRPLSLDYVPTLYGIDLKEIGTPKRLAVL